MDCIYIQLLRGLVKSIPTGSCGPEASSTDELYDPAFSLLKLKTLDPFKGIEKVLQ
jgi:hypothetical protein